MSRSKDGKDTGAERGMQPEKPRDANEVCQKEVDLEMISCSGSTRIKEKFERKDLNHFGLGRELSWLTTNAKRSVSTKSESSMPMD